MKSARRPETKPADGTGRHATFLPQAKHTRGDRPAARKLVGALLPFLAAITAIALHACQTASDANDAALVQGLQLAEVALAAEQTDVARRLYQSLAKRYPDAAAPRLRLARIAFEQGDFRTAREHFLMAAEMPLAERTRAEAWYGAGRAALAQENAPDAYAHFQRARALAVDSVASAWIANGLAVAAIMEANPRDADAHYTEALALDPDNPRIMANYVRMLAESGQVEKADQLFAGRAPEFWSDDDEQRLRLLIRERRQE